MVLVDMSDFRSWAKGFRCNVHLWVVVGMNDFGSWAHGCRCYEQLKVVDDMKTLGLELNPLDIMNISGLWLTWMIPGHELRGLGSMNYLRLLMTWTTPDRELRALDLWRAQGCGGQEPLFVIISNLWILWTTQGYGWYEQLKFMSLRL